MMDDMIRLCLERNIFLISDEIYGDIIFDDDVREVSALNSALMPQAKDHVIWLGGVSKAFAMTGFRVGFARAPRHLMSVLEKNQEALISCGVTFSQRGAAAVLADPFSASSCIEAANKSYGRRRDMAVQCLADMGLPMPKRLVPQGAFYMLVPCGAAGTPDVSEEVARDLLNRADVACAPGGNFGKEGENFLRLSFATADDDVRQGTTRLAKYLLEHRDAASWWPKDEPVTKVEASVPPVFDRMPNATTASMP